MKFILYAPLIFFLIFPGLVSCFFGGYQQSKVGVPLKPEKVAQIRLGGTTLKEVLSWLGPPDFIIDGTQQIPNADAIGAAYSGLWHNVEAWTKPISPRLLTAPEGTVILIYTNIVTSSGFVMAGIAGRGGRKVSEGELFVFVSKDTLIVTDLAIGSPP